MMILGPDGISILQNDPHIFSKKKLKNTKYITKDRQGISRTQISRDHHNIIGLIEDETKF